MKTLVSSAFLKIRPVIDRLGFRLAVVLAIGLLPLMLVSVVRSQSVVSEALARSEAALVGETLQAVRAEAVLIENAKAIAASLSHTMPDLMRDIARCDRDLAKMVEDTPYSFVGFFDVTGRVECSSLGVQFTFPMTDTLARQVADASASVTVNQEAPAANSSVIFATQPVLDADGTLIGFTRVSLPHRELRKLEDDATSAATFLTVMPDGTVLTSSSGIDGADDFLPMLRPGETISDLPLSFQRRSLRGDSRVYSAVPVVDGELYAVSSWPRESELGEFYLDNPALFPALMWLASLGVAWFATSVFVTRDVVKLRRSMTDFAERRAITDPNAFSGAPGELRDVANSFMGMAEVIVRDEAEIEDALRQKDVLLREVHHRVKNNLQLITSIMAMQMQHSSTPEVESLMRNLHGRVNSIATVHHNLYQTSGQVDVTMDELLGIIVKQIVKVGVGGNHQIKVTTDLDKLTLNPDQAVPLALFATEALTNAMKYMGPDGSQHFVEVILKVQPDNRAVLKVENSFSDAVDPVLKDQSTGLGSELMEAFAMQLGGTMASEGNAGLFTVSVDFPMEDLLAKEN